MAHHHQVIKYPLLAGPEERPRFKETTVDMTNGIAALSMTVKDDVRAQSILVTMKPDDATALAIALLVGAYNVDHGFHANTNLAARYDNLTVALRRLQELADNATPVA